MGSDLYVSASGAMARLRDLEIVANNLANADTAGFKRDAPIFESALESALLDVSGNPTPGGAGRAFVDTQIVATDYRSGPVATTGAPLDVAIEGPGFFEVRSPEGTQYTRAGSFVINRKHELSTPDGFPVLGDGGPIRIGSRPVSIAETGEVIDDAGDVQGRLRVVSVDRVDALEKVGRNLFRATAGAGVRAIEQPVLIPQSVERSNVVPVKELASMVMLQRAFEISMRALRSDDQATEQLLREFLS